MRRALMWAILFCFSKATISLSKKKIFIGALVYSYGDDAQGFKTAMEHATEIINNRSDILKDYEIVVKYTNTFSSPIYTVLGVFGFLQWPKNESIQVMIGPAWSKNAGPAAIASASWNVLQISYGATSVELHNDEYYHTLFTNVPSTSFFNYARLAVLKYFGWKRVAILQEYDDKLYSSAVENFQSVIESFSANVSIITLQGYQKGLADHPKKELQRLQKLDARIIIGEFSIDRAAEVFCEAYKLGMYGPKYVWILAATSTGAWIFTNDVDTFSKHHMNIDCNISQVAKAAEGFITISQVDIRQDDNVTVSGLTSREYLAEVQRRNKKAQPYTSYAFDSIWAAALMLNETSNTTRPEDLVLGDDKFFYEYKDLLQKQEFEGLSGPHKFYKRERIGTVVIRQMRLTENDIAYLEQVGSHDSYTNELSMNENEVRKMWKDGKVPVDETRKERKVLIYSLAQLILIGVFAVLGLIYSLGLLYFNIEKRNHKVIRMSSPMINNVVLLGCFFCYVFVFLLGIDSRFVDEHVLGILCNVRLYVLAIAFSMAFGALFSKTWRVHKIFTAQRAIKRKMMQDFHLILFVLVLVLVDVVFVTLWIIFDPLKSEDIIFDMEQSNDLITIPVLKICDCTHKTKLLGALYGYKGILLLFGVFLAWETRNVTIPALNDSKYIGMSVYNVVILSAIGATVSMVLKRTAYYELLHVLVSVVVLLSTTVTLTMVFLPKVQEFYTTPPEPQERVRTMETLNISMKTTTTTEDVYEAYVKPKDVKHKCIQTEDFNPATTEDALYKDIKTGINEGFSVDKEGDKVLEEKLQKYKEYKVGSLGHFEFQDDKDWY
ncbi:gamma-aminobutyric acid type B receptor subunit 2-like isoform X2 [Dendronephthya gigantea]|nr:gamma-aminobutyric acid type B receptor subunit 2-like isoform X2 [Dendronephthya gigantea]